MKKTLAIEKGKETSLVAVLTALKITVPTSTENNGMVEYEVEVDDAQLKQLEAIQGVNENWGMIIKDGINKVITVVTDGVDSAATNVMVPLGNAALKTAAAGGRILVKAAGLTCASAINNVVDESARAVRDVKNSDEYQQLTGKTWSTIKSIFTDKKAFVIK